MAVGGTEGEGVNVPDWKTTDPQCEINNRVVKLEEFKTACSGSAQVGSRVSSSEYLCESRPAADAGESSTH